MGNNAKKRIYLINRDFQLRYTSAAMVVGAFSSILTMVVILFPLYQFEILRIPRFLPVPILAAMVLAVLLNVAFVGMLSIFITHRIAGPMYGLLRHIRRVEGMKFQSHVRTRDGDELGFIIRNFNDMVSALVSMTKTDISLIKDVKAELEGNGQGSKDDLIKLLDDKLVTMESRIERDED